MWKQPFPRPAGLTPYQVRQLAASTVPAVVAPVNMAMKVGDEETETEEMDETVDMCAPAAAATDGTVMRFADYSAMLEAHAKSVEVVSPNGRHMHFELQPPQKKKETVVVPVPQYLRTRAMAAAEEAVMAAAATSDALAGGVTFVPLSAAEMQGPVPLGRNAPVRRQLAVEVRNYAASIDNGEQRAEFMRAAESTEQATRLEAAYRAGTHVEYFNGLFSWIKKKAKKAKDKRAAKKAEKTKSPAPAYAAPFQFVFEKLEAATPARPSLGVEIRRFASGIADTELRAAFLADIAHPDNAEDAAVAYRADTQAEYFGGFLHWVSKRSQNLADYRRKKKEKKAQRKADAEAGRSAREADRLSAAALARPSLGVEVRRFANGIEDAEMRAAFLADIAHPDNATDVAAAYSAGTHVEYFGGFLRWASKRAQNLADYRRKKKEKKAQQKADAAAGRAAREGQAPVPSGMMSTPAAAPTPLDWLAERNANAAALAQQMEASGANGASAFDKSVWDYVKGAANAVKHGVMGSRTEDLGFLSAYTGPSAEYDDAALKFRLAKLLYEDGEADPRRHSLALTHKELFEGSLTPQSRAVTVALAGDGALDHRTPVKAMAVPVRKLRPAANGALGPEMAKYMVWEFDMTATKGLTKADFLQRRDNRSRSGKTVELHLGAPFTTTWLKPDFTVSEESPEALDALIWYSGGRDESGEEQKRRLKKNPALLAFKPPVLLRFSGPVNGSENMATLLSIIVLAPATNAALRKATDHATELQESLPAFAELVAAAILTPVAQAALESALGTLAQRRFITAGERERGLALSPILATALAVHAMPRAGKLAATQRVTLAAGVSTVSPAHADVERAETVLQHLGDECIAALEAGADPAVLARQLAKSIGDATSAQPQQTAAVLSQMLHANAARIVNHGDALSRVALLWEEGVSALDAAFGL